MKKFLNIIKLEYKNIFKDPGVMLIMVLGALLYSLFYAMPYSTEVLRDVPIGVIDNSNSQLSRDFIRKIDANEYIKVSSRPSSIEEATDQFYSGKIKSYVVIPKNFERDLYRGSPVKVSLYSDSSYLLIYRQVANGIITTATAMGAQIEIGKLMKSGLSKQQATLVRLPFEYIQIPLFNPASGYASYIYPVVLILILQQTMLVGIGLLGGTLREQNKEFCEIKLSLPFVIIAKSTAYVLLYLIHSIFYFLVFPIIFNYPMHFQILNLLILLIPYLYAVSFLGQALVYFFKERETSILVIVVTSLPMVFLPGFIWPKESIPPILNFFANFIPSTNAIGGLVRVNQMDATLWQVRENFFVLICLCAFYFICAYFAVRKST